MNSSIECIPCFIRQAVSAIKKVSDDPSFQEKALRETLTMISQLDYKQSPPASVQKINSFLKKFAGTEDIFFADKKLQNETAVKLAESLSDEIKKADDKLHFAVKLAIAGNIIDLGVKGHVSEKDIKESLYKAINEPLDGDYAEFISKLDQAENILYLADNAGEIIFDRLLLEELKHKNVTFAVRGAPIINDATVEDAEFAEIHEVAKIITNGFDAPGTVYDSCSDEFKEYFTKADIIISKGQGNFESLYGINGPIFFLFKVKCDLVASNSDYPTGSQLLLKNKKLTTA